MIGWFKWKNSRSDAMGLWVSVLPPIIRPEERNQKIDIPGRAGSLIMLQGEDVYMSYVKECTVTCRRDIVNIQNIMNWLRGEGVVIFGNEPNKAYKAMILSAVRFERVDNNLMQAVIPFYVEPFKESIYPANETVQFTSDLFNIYNPGDVASKPKVTIARTGDAVNLTMAIGSMSMYFPNLTGTIVVDCDAEIVTKNNAIYAGSFTGDFWRIPKGSVAITKDKSVTVTIEPRWRWV